MEKEYLREKLNSIRTEMNYLWTGVIVTFGGAFSFSVFSVKDAWLYICMIAGIVMGLIFLNAFIIRRTELKDIINMLNREGK